VTKRIFIPVLMAMLVAALAFGQDSKESKGTAKKDQTTSAAPKAKKVSKSARGKSCDGDCCTEGSHAKSKAPKAGSDSETKASESKDAK
jgi:hypothetical protein